MQTQLRPYQCFDPSDLPGEKWQNIPGLENYYQISSFGRIKRPESLRRGKKGSYRRLPERILKATLTKSFNHFTGDTREYLTITLWLEGKAHHFGVARLVYYAFVAPFDLGDRNLFIFYSDGDTLNLGPPNLMLGGQREKQERLEQAGRRDKPFASISAEQRKAIQQKINATKAEHGIHRIGRYSLSGKLLETYVNAEAAAKACKTNAGTLSKAARGYKRITAKGYLWRRGAEPEIDISALAEQKGIQRSPAVKHLERLGQYDLEGNLVATYSSIREASQMLRLGYNHISGVVNGKKLTYGGWLWRWGTRKKISVKKLQQEKGYRYSPVSAKERQVSQYNLDGVWLRSFASIAQAERETGIDWKSIQQVTQGKSMTAGGYLWRRGVKLRIKTNELARLPAYQNSALQRYHKARRTTRIMTAAMQA